MKQLIVAVMFASQATLPPIPPLPPSDWPSAAVAVPFAHQLIERVSPAELARRIDSNPDLVPGLLRNLGTAAMSDDRVFAYAASVARNSKGDAQHLATLLILDPARYERDAAFHQRLNRFLPKTLSQLPHANARAVLEELNRSAAIEFDVSDAAAAAAHLTSRVSTVRRVAYDAKSLRIPDDFAPIEASIFSLNSAFFTPAEVKRFIDAVHAASPDRRVIVLGDIPVNATRIDAFGRAFTPWPRDPFITARDRNGGITFINRPNAQPDREDDQNMARAIVSSWNAHWTVAPVPFHNGHILTTPEAVWISVHSVEPRALAMLGLDHVPTDDLPRYFAAARRAAEELEHFYGKPVRFVHPIDPSLGDAIGGGANFDLDSIVTILPNSLALVGDTHLGIAMTRTADWSAVQREYPLRGTRDDYIASQEEPRTVGLQRFLDLVANELQRKGMKVQRLPLLDIPSRFVAREDVAQDRDFLMTWNNVVIDGHRAEGFASRLASVDDDVRRTFAANGIKLAFFPPLTHSIVLGGGYRCASNHVRK